MHARLRETRDTAHREGRGRPHAAAPSPPPARGRAGLALSRVGASLRHLPIVFLALGAAGCPGRRAEEQRREARERAVAQKEAELRQLKEKAQAQARAERLAARHAATSLASPLEGTFALLAALREKPDALRVVKTEPRTVSALVGGTQPPRLLEATARYYLLPGLALASFTVLKEHPDAWEWSFLSPHGVERLAPADTVRPLPGRQALGPTEVRAVIRGPLKGALVVPDLTGLLNARGHARIRIASVAYVRHARTMLLAPVCEAGLVPGSHPVGLERFREECEGRARALLPKRWEVRTAPSRRPSEAIFVDEDCGRSWLMTYETADRDGPVNLGNPYLPKRDRRTFRFDCHHSGRTGKLTVVLRKP